MPNEPAGASQPRRGFFLPAIGLMLLFGALGPGIGGAVFIPLAMYAEAQQQTIMHIGWIAGLIGHAVALVPAYLIGFVPSVLMGLAYALYDAWAPRTFPRALGAAALGAFSAHLLYLWLIWAGAALSGWIVADFGDEAGSYLTEWTSGEFDAGLYHALIASGAIAAFACAACAGLLRLSTAPIRQI